MPSFLVHKFGLIVYFVGYFIVLLNEHLLDLLLFLLLEFKEDVCTFCLGLWVAKSSR